MDAKIEMMSRDGHLNEEVTALFVDALMQKKKPDVPQEVLEHVDTCPDCKNSIIDIVTFLGNPDATDRKPIKRRKSHPNGKYYVYRGRIAAAITAFAVLLSVYLVFLNNPTLLDTNDSITNQSNQAISNTPQTPGNNQKQNPLSHSTIQPKPTPHSTKRVTRLSPKEQTNHQANAAFQVNPNLENMIGSPVRGSMFEAVTPKNNTIVRPDGNSLDPVRFSWKEPLPIPHTLKIVTNSNREIYRFKVKKDSFVFNDKLEPGLYYWKLENTSELLYVGKFQVGQPDKNN